MFIDSDEYPLYSNLIYDLFGTNINARIQCDHGYPYYSIKYNIFTWINEKSW